MKHRFIIPTLLLSVILPAQAIAVEKAEDDNMIAFGVNVLSGLQWGQTASVEAGNVFSGLVRVRVPHWTVFSAISNTHKNWSIGIAGELRWYFQSRNLRGWFTGLGLEYSQMEWEYHNHEHYDDGLYTTKYITPYVELGYRWILKHFYIGAGVELAVPVWIKKDGEYPDGRTTTKKIDPIPMPQVNLNIGLTF